MHTLNIDIETYSSVDLKKSGLYRYVQSPDFQILLFAYSLDGGPVRVVDLTKEQFLPQEVLRYMFDADAVKYAYNAAFEWYCLSKYFDLSGIVWDPPHSGGTATGAAANAQCNGAFPQGQFICPEDAKWEGAPARPAAVWDPPHSGGTAASAAANAQCNGAFPQGQFTCPEDAKWEGAPARPAAWGWLPQWRCTMLHGLYCGYPAGLAAVGAALGLPQERQKMAAGGALIRYFCVPCKPSKKGGGRTRNLPHHDPDKWAMFQTYCGQDVAVEMEVARRLARFPVPGFVQDQWVADQIINARGIAVDDDMVQGALWCGQKVRDALLAEAHRPAAESAPHLHRAAATRAGAGQGPPGGRAGTDLRQRAGHPVPADSHRLCGRAGAHAGRRRLLGHRGAGDCLAGR